MEGRIGVGNFIHPDKSCPYVSVGYDKFKEVSQELKTFLDLVSKTELIEAGYFANMFGKHLIIVKADTDPSPLRSMPARELIIDSADIVELGKFVFDKSKVVHLKKGI